MPYGEQRNPVSMRDQAEFVQRVRGLRDIPTEEFNEVFELADIETLCEYQQGETALGLAAKPYPDSFIEKYGSEIAGMLDDNTSEYDDDLEAGIAEDPVIVEISSARLKDPKNRELILALRARRSVIAILLQDIPVPEHDYLPTDNDKSKSLDEDVA